MSWACEVITKGRLWPLFGDQRKKGVRAEFERVSFAQLPWLYTCAVYFTKDTGMAEDLVQDTYLLAFRRVNTYGPGTNCRVLAQTLAKRLLRSIFSTSIWTKNSWFSQKLNGA